MRWRWAVSGFTSRFATPGNPADITQDGVLGAHQQTSRTGAGTAEAALGADAAVGADRGASGTGAGPAASAVELTHMNGASRIDEDPEEGDHDPEAGLLTDSARRDSRGGMPDSLQGCRWSAVEDLPRHPDWLVEYHMQGSPATPI